MKITTVSTITATAALTASQLAGGVVLYTGAVGTLTTPTATALNIGVFGADAQGDAISGVNGYTIDFVVRNGGSGVATLAAGTGVTLATGNVNAVPVDQNSHFRLIRSSPTTWTCYYMGGALTGDFVGRVNPLTNRRVTTTTTYTSSTTLTTPTGMTAVTLEAGKTYRIRGQMYVTSTANGGVKVALTAVTLTATSFIALTSFCDLSVNTNGSMEQVTALGTLQDAAEVVTSVEINGMLTVNAGGTLALQTAQSTSHADTTSILAGSWIEYEEVA